MALVIKDRVKETTNTTGNHTNDYDLLGAVSGFEAFSANLSGSDTTYYVCTDNTDFEIGLGTYNSSTDKLARTTILASSNSNNSVVWSSGTRSIFMTYPADKAVFEDASNNINGTFVGNITGDVTGNADTATALANARTIGGVSFDGTANINLPGVNTSGNQDTSGNATTATTLETAREINGTSFNGGANITVTAAAGTLTGNTLNSTVTASSLTSLGTLASNLNLGGQDIVTTTSNQDIDLAAHGTGKVVIKGNTNQGAIKLNCENNSHGQTLKAAPHSESADNTLTLPSTGGDARLVSATSTATLTNKTLTSPVLNTGVSGTAIKDEDDMTSDSATHLATQQSIKAYVDAQKADMQFVLEDGDGTEVQITKDSEVKFVEGGGLDINWTDTSTGSDGDPYDLTFTVNAAQTGITSLVNTSLEIGRDADNRIKFGTDNQIIFEVSGGDNVIFKASGEIEASSLDISGDADIDGTLEADAITVGGTALNTVIAGVTVTNATTAAVATTVTITDNESTNEDNAIIFTAGGDVDGGNIGLESDGTLTYNPSTGKITATGFIGALTGNADTASAVAADNISTGDAAVTIATSSGNITLDAQGSDTDIKFKGTDGSSDITALTLDMSNGGSAVFSNNINLSSDSSILKFGADNEITLTHVHDTGLKLNSTSQLQFGDSGTYIHQSADGVLDLVSDSEIEINATTIDMNGALDVSGTITSGGVITGTGFTIGSAVIAEAELEQLDGITAGTVAASKAVVVDANKDVASFRNVTLTGELDAATGDFSGDVDIDGTLEADAITVNGTALNTVIADEATALAIALG